MVLLAVVIGTYYATRELNPKPAGPIEHLSIAIPAVPHAALLYVALAKGYFAEEGLAISIVQAAHGKEAVQHVVQGKADLGTASEVVLLLAAAKGQPLAIAANVFSSSHDLAVVARQDLGIANPRDLVSKRIGVTLGTASEYFLWAFLVRHKLPYESVTLVDMAPVQLAPAIAARAIDATSTWQPHVSSAQAALGNKALTYYEPLAYKETFNIIGNPDLLRQRSGAIEKLLRAILKAETFIETQPNEALELIAKQLNVGIEYIRPIWKHFAFRVELPQSHVNTLEEQARWAMARGYIEQGPMPNFLPNLHLDALLAVRRERVTVMH